LFRLNTISLEQKNSQSIKGEVMKKVTLLIALLLFAFVAINAQSDETKEKLKNLKGEAIKITIETEDGEIEITGDDAELLLTKMKSQKNIMIKKMNHSDMDKHGNIFFFKEGEEHGLKELKIDVEIEDANGEKVVVIKKIVDGKETVKEYKGEAAQKFIKGHSKGEHNMKFISEDGEANIVVELDGKDLKWVSEGSEHDVMKKVKVVVNDGVKKVTVTTTEDGKKNVEVFEGEEAEKYLEKMDHEKKMKIHLSEDCEKKVMKKKIIIIEEDDNEKD
jgi:hypothetical protein